LIGTYNPVEIETDWKVEANFVRLIFAAVHLASWSQLGYKGR